MLPAAARRACLVSSLMRLFSKLPGAVDGVMGFASRGLIVCWTAKHGVVLAFGHVQDGASKGRSSLSDTCRLGQGKDVGCGWEGENAWKEVFIGLMERSVHRALANCNSTAATCMSLGDEQAGKHLAQGNLSEVMALPFNPSHSALMPSIV